MADVMLLTDVKSFQLLFFATVKTRTAIANVIFKVPALVTSLSCWIISKQVNFYFQFICCAKPSKAHDSHDTPAINTFKSSKCIFQLQTVQPSGAEIMTIRFCEQCSAHALAEYQPL